MGEEGRLKFFSKDLDFEYLIGQKFPKLEKKNSKIDGKGIFSKQKIMKGQIVCPLFGILYNMNKAKIDYPKYSYQISDEIAIETLNEPGFLNHSCEPNVFINKDWNFEAITDIEKGEEILVDYATVDYFDYGFECKCKSSSCVGKFNGLQSEDKNCQKNKSRFFSPYLKQKFNL